MTRMLDKAEQMAAGDGVSRFSGKRVHFIGIGGCGMAGLARMLLDRGAIVSGSEPNPNTQSMGLSEAGARISRDQLGSLLTREHDLVVRTAAVKDDNPEYRAAMAMGHRPVKYAKLLGQVMAERLGVAVAGTHGKSTTTAMLAWALLGCGMDPSFVVGGHVEQLGGSSRSGAGKVFVAEACEFDRSFHNLHPRVAIVTNIEEDHLDCYKDIDDIVESFRTFAGLVPAGGRIISNAKDANCRRALAGSAASVEWCGLEEGCDWSARTTGIDAGCYRAEVRHKGAVVGELRLKVAGQHNLINALMALAACEAVGADLARALAALGDFAGVARRMTEMGRCNGAIVIDDYGHHPTEIRATLKAARERYEPKRLFCVFQPHQHSRTRFFLDDFAESLSHADQTIVPDIYFVRDSEAERLSVSATDLVDRISRRGRIAYHIPSFADIARHLRKESREGDLIVILGAGNVWEIGRDLVGG